MPGVSTYRAVQICGATSKDNIVPQVQPLDPLNKRCLGDCIEQHELNHIKDLLVIGSSPCNGKPKGTIVTFDTNDQIKASERKSYDVEISCLQAKLSGGQPLCECRPTIESRINQLRDARKTYE